MSHRQNAFLILISVMPFQSKSAWRAVSKSNYFVTIRTYAPLLSVAGIFTIGAFAGA